MGLILLVEDEQGAAALLRRYIENSSDGHRLAVFGKAAEALSFAAQNKVDLFILDIQLLDYRGDRAGKAAAGPAGIPVYPDPFYHGTGRGGAVCLQGN